MKSVRVCPCMCDWVRRKLEPDDMATLSPPLNKSRSKPCIATITPASSTSPRPHLKILFTANTQSQQLYQISITQKIYEEHLQQITHLSPQYQKIDVLVMKVLQQITNPIPITYKFLVITKTHLFLT